KLLTPGASVRVKVRREGKYREIPVTVEARPATAITESATITTRGAFPVAGREVRVRAGAPNAPLSSMTFMAGSATMLGAQLNPIDNEVAETLGVEAGLLVLRVQRGSPFADAGIRDGEIIRMVNGMPVRDLLVWQRLLSSASAHELKLTVWNRETSSRAVTLRW
ncbi:MAG: PDZ domain-containing protein, partial [Gemmatimonadaceae bacterium]|nr:PDZ domain-containing protein [Gemmatimonadaceae bacterium]